MKSLRPCRHDEVARILEIVNAAAQAYSGVIPPDVWHEPYMSRGELERDMAAGVAFWGLEDGGELVGVMGMQGVGNVDLIRHAYVLPDRQRSGVGSALIAHLCKLSTKRMLVGTWAAASWAIDFYRRHGFEPVSRELAATLLRKYWTISERQIETSVVLEYSRVS